MSEMLIDIRISEHPENPTKKLVGFLDLPNSWRLTYTLMGDSIKIVSVILEWMDHKDYEKRFGYN